MWSRLSGCRLRGQSSPGGAGIVLYSTACSPSWLAHSRTSVTARSHGLLKQTAPHTAEKLADRCRFQLTARETGAWSNGIFGLVFTENSVTASITPRDTTNKSSSDTHLDHIRYVRCPWKCLSLNDRLFTTSRSQSWRIPRSLPL